MSTKFQEEVMLPSKGLAYPQGYIPEGKVVISMMGTQEEKILAGGKMNFNTMLTTILDRLIVSPKIESSKLLTLDRMFLLIKIRVLSLGSKYSFKMKCSECGEESEFEVELAELEIKDFPDNWTEPLACHLPILDEEIKLRLLRATDEVDVDRYVQKLRAKNARLFQQGDPTYIPLMAKAVVSTSNLEESSLFQDKIAWVQELKSRDSIAIQDTLSDNDFGVVMQTEVTCPVCGAELDGVNIGLDPSFFRPRSRSK